MVYNAWSKNKTSLKVAKRKCNMRKLAPEGEHSCSREIVMLLE